MLTGRRCAVAGSPIAHSLSPAIHAAAYRELGLDDWEYTRYELVADDLAGFVDGLDASWRGLSCTMPLKAAVVPLGRPDDVVALLGVGNTVVFDGVPGDPATTRVCNTDVPGLDGALREAGAAGAATALVLGNGATARSGVAALARLGVREVTVMARDAAKTEPLVALGDRVGVVVRHRALGEPGRADVVVSTVPASAQTGLAEAVAAAAGVVFDVTYDPWPTPLAEAAERRGAVVVNGLDLLAWQAVFQVDLFTGRTVTVDVLRQAAVAALAAGR